MGVDTSDGHDGIHVPVALCGNQCAVLFDVMPTDNKFLHGVWMVTMFNFTWIQMDFVFAFANLTVGCDGQGIDHPDSISVQDSQFVKLAVTSLSAVSWAIVSLTRCLVGPFRTGIGCD